MFKKILRIPDESLLDSIFLIVVYDVIESKTFPEFDDNLASIVYKFGSSGDQGLKFSFEILIDISSYDFPLAVPTTFVLVI